MRRSFLPLVALLVAVSATLPGDAFAQAGPARYAVLVQGASGEPQFAKQHRGWIDQIAAALSEQFKMSPDHVFRLTEQPAAGERRATAAEVKAVFGDLAQRMSPSDVALVVLVGHGTGDGDAAKFNLIGPDLTVAEWGDLLTPLKGRVVFVNTASGSSAFLKGVTGDRRIVITGTAIPSQRYATIFAGSFAEALTATAADLDKNGRISIWEAFSYAVRLQKEYFEQKGQLASERAALEDNGDGVGREGAATSGEDGMLATMTYLDAVVDARPTDPQLQMLLQRQDLLTQELDALRRKKASMPQTEYDAAFEKLMVDLATLGAEIRKRGGGGD
jgi:hypothetical protein